jgi:hypothetical protein
LIQEFGAGVRRAGIGAGVRGDLDSRTAATGENQGKCRWAGGAQPHLRNEVVHVLNSLFELLLPYKVMDDSSKGEGSLSSRGEMNLQSTACVLKSRVWNALISVVSEMSFDCHDTPKSVQLRKVQAHSFFYLDKEAFLWIQILWRREELAGRRLPERTTRRIDSRTMNADSDSIFLRVN